MIAGRIGDRLERLALPQPVRGFRHHHMGARNRHELGAPRPEREAAEILAERGGTPVLPAVNRDNHSLDAVAGVPGDALDLERPSGGDLGAVHEILISEFTTSSVIGVFASVA